MALAGEIKTGTTISHFGTWSKVTGASVEDRKVVLLVQEDGAIGKRIEDPKTNIPVLDE